MKILQRDGIWWLTIFALVMCANLCAHAQAPAVDLQTAPLFDLDAFMPSFEAGLLRENRSLQTYQKYFSLEKKSPAVQQRRAKLCLWQAAYASAVAKIQRAPPSAQAKIPRLVHQIWLGSDVPEHYRAWMESWMHWQGWEYKLWTDKEVASLQLVNQKAYDRAVNYGEKSDIVRYEVLYLMGGLYVDVDFKCVEARFFDALHDKVDFYAGIEPLEHELLRVGNSLIGSRAGHPLLAKIIHNLADNSIKKPKWHTLERTGPRYLTHQIAAYLADQSDPAEVNLFLPSVSFYPYTGCELAKPHAQDLPPPPGAAAIHYWAGSWAP